MVAVVGMAAGGRGSPDRGSGCAQCEVSVIHFSGVSGQRGQVLGFAVGGLKSCLSFWLLYGLSPCCHDRMIILSCD